MTAPLLIRDFEPSDLDAVIALNMRATYPDHPADREYTALNYPALLDIPAAFQRDGAFLVGTVDGEVVAMGAVCPVEHGTFELDYLRVAIPHHRVGHGRRMVEALEACVTARGGDAVVLNTTVQQVPAQRLYESMGFEETHRSVVKNLRGVEFHLINYRKAL